MASDLWAKINYTSDISYINNVFIYELDISKANIEAECRYLEVKNSEIELYQKVLTEENLI